MRKEEEVQRAHDIIHAVAAREVQLGIDPSLLGSYRIAHDVLSWVLEGACQQAFTDILDGTMEVLKDRGYELVRKV